jgi:Flp pilus assembly protein TadB
LDNIYESVSLVDNKNKVLNRYIAYTEDLNGVIWMLPNIENDIMKKWNFKVESSPKEISKNIESALESVNGLVFNMNHDKNNSITFKMRKRILYAWYLFYLNSIVVNGKLSKTDIEKETDVEISFNQHFLWKLVIFTDMSVGLGFFIAVISGKISGASMYIIATTILAVGVILWIRVQKKYERNIQEYKTMISEILAI